MDSPGSNRRSSRYRKRKSMLLVFVCTASVFLMATSCSFLSLQRAFLFLFFFFAVIALIFGSVAFRSSLYLPVHILHLMLYNCL
ncbi:hypothetical protein P170DRAFT_243501 [Aspergillus steynii IBT 23096]|uniref:Uncharacterized protein n=1 Tax=Aspergillus steynii IBT 23096 TaxID=1392250 RepID=A0A2I2FXQ8_9EURO|nr:uncharacterized protein P170DRAFT_243501 [Aspergillus steynii IBT 23096]PLB45418.1 hypothetical protein P170DRAFT_243501 [Aspergillus steynii IBT 23096]